MPQQTCGCPMVYQPTPVHQTSIFNYPIGNVSNSKCLMATFRISIFPTSKFLDDKCPIIKWLYEECLISNCLTKHIFKQNQMSARQVLPCQRSVPQGTAPCSRSGGSIPWSLWHQVSPGTLDTECTGSLLTSCCRFRWGRACNDGQRCRRRFLLGKAL